VARQIIFEILSQKDQSQKRAGGVAQGIGPEFKLQHHKQTNKQTKNTKKERRSRETNLGFSDPEAYSFFLYSTHFKGDLSFCKR
jgi:hypothetical protein